jgi:hypothetical protein
MSKESLIVIPAYTPPEDQPEVSYRFKFVSRLPVLYISKPLLLRLRRSASVFHNRRWFRPRRIQSLQSIC